MLVSDYVYAIVAMVAVLIVIMLVFFIYSIKKNKERPIYRIDISNFELLDKMLLNSTKDVEKIITNKLHEFENKQGENRIKELQEYNQSVDRIKSLKEEITNSFTSFKENTAKTISDNLEKNFGQTKETIQDITQRLTKIDSAQTQITEFKETIDDFNRVMTDKKARGIFGEFQLEAMFNSVVGETKDSIFQRQVKLSNQNQVDGLLRAPKEIGDIPIDSKFPLDNYRAMLDANTPLEKENAKKAFARDCKNKIEDISKKYIIKGETADFAFMFIPAEAVFIALHSFEFHTVLDFAKKNNVYIVSPSTLFIVIQEIFKLNKLREIKENLKPILAKLTGLETEFIRFKDRWQKFVAALEKEQELIKDLNTTQGKIVKKFAEINSISNQEKLKETSNFDVTENSKNCI